MFKFLPIHLLFLLLFSHFISKAQDRTNYALLWQIESPNSEKKSYLFGTAHLRDSRVFDFSDAMLPAISQSEAFALEVHPDSVSGAISKYIMRHENNSYYRDVLSNNEYKKLDARVIAETGESLDSLNYNSLYFLESILRPELAKEGDKETFLDAYLYGVANTLNKNIYGLEKLEDQMPNLDSIPRDELRESLLDLIDLDEEEYREGVARLLDVYTSGDIDRILLMSQGLFTIDKVMLLRNQVMTKSMKRIMETQSLFAAVGAAHLPGDYGIINLLREDGYVVSKVENTFTGSSNNFVVKPNIKKWKTFEDPKMGYQLKVPGVSQTMPMQDGFEMKMSQDLLSGVSFFHFPMDLRSRGVVDMKGVTAALLARFISTADSTKIVPSQVDRKGKTFIQALKTNPENGKFMRIEVFAENGVLYVFGSEYTDSTAAIATVAAYFNSISITEAMPVEVPSVVWNSFDSPAGGFTVDMPGEVKDRSRETSNPQDPDGAPYKLNMYMGLDLKNQYNYLIRYNNFPLGYYLENESAIANEFAEAFVNQGQGTLLISKKKITYQGMPGYDLELKIQNKYNSKVRYLSRGNKTYLLLAQKLNETDTASFDNPVFNSFQIKDYLPAQYQTITAEDNSYSFIFPKEISKEITVVNEFNSEYEQSIDYFGLEENSGDVFTMTEIKFKPYFKIKSKEKFYDEYVSLIKNDGDSIFKQEFFLYEGLEAKDFYVRNELTTIVQKYRVVIVGDKIITLSTYQSPEHIDGIRSMEVMNGLKIMKPKSVDVFASKSKAIFKALRSKDTLEYQEAAGALDYYNFEAKDEKLLQKNLYAQLPADSLYWGVKNLIVFSLGRLGLNSSLPALKEYYLSDKSNTKNKLMTLQALTEVNTSEAMDLYVDLLKNHPPKNTKENDADLFGYSVDSLLTIQKYGPDVVTIQKNDALRAQTISYFQRQIAQDSIFALPFLREHVDEFIGYFYKDVTQYLDPKAPEDSKMNLFTLGTYIHIIDTLSVKSPKVIALTKRLFVDQKEANYISLRGFVYYINNAETIDAAAVQRFIEPQYYRFEGIKALLDAGKPDLIPAQYLEKKAMAEISIYNWVGYDSAYPNAITYKDTYTQDGKKYMAFVYTFDTEERQGKEYLSLVLDQEFLMENPMQFNVLYQYDTPLEEDWKQSAKDIIDSYAD